MFSANLIYSLLLNKAFQLYPLLITYLFFTHKQSEMDLIL